MCGFSAITEFVMRITSNLKYLCRVVVRIKTRKIVEIGLGSTLYQKVEILNFWGATYPPYAPIEVKFCTAKWTNVPLGRTEFHVNQCEESPLWVFGD